MLYFSPKTNELVPVGTKLSNDDIRYHFGGRNMGGLRYSVPYVHLIVINNSDVDFFSDQHLLVDSAEIIIYFGEGDKGDQSISRGNKTLYNSNSKGTPLHYFIKEKYRKENIYTYNGRVELIDETTKLNEFRDEHGRLIAKRGIDGIPTLLGNFTHKEAFKAIRGPYRARFYERFNKWYPYLDKNGIPRSVILFPLRKLEGDV